MFTQTHRKKSHVIQQVNALMYSVKKKNKVSEERFDNRVQFKA